jgi:hypothetical protein
MAPTNFPTMNPNSVPGAPISLPPTAVAPNVAPPTMVNPSTAGKKAGGGAIVIVIVIVALLVGVAIGYVVFKRFGGKGSNGPKYQGVGQGNEGHAVNPDYEDMRGPDDDDDEDLLQVGSLNADPRRGETPNEA